MLKAVEDSVYKLRRGINYRKKIIGREQITNITLQKYKMDLKYVVLGNTATTVHGSFT
jgi:hypothetical protein